MLAEVKDLYEQKYGKSVDSDGEDFEYDEDGTLWVRSITMPARSNQEKLEDLLAEVKGLYKQKYGESVDDEGRDFEYDEDGTLWVKSITMPSRPNQEKLEDMLRTRKNSRTCCLR
eukprot:TRINITY_DN717_c0_g1_i4.p1 TRINITY_DN717_c0_g1~~TRINITY_DN717_c0_g1_i4.p1  ORF type:complete len:115 (-),score=30.64 TRINITY_DN717_c0_g1_i4:149-493(-)